MLRLLVLLLAVVAVVVDVVKVMIAVSIARRRPAWIAWAVAVAASACPR